MKSLQEKEVRRMRIRNGCIGFYNNMVIPFVQGAVVGLVVVGAIIVIDKFVHD